jgi:fatty-acyl-CoA synthase
VNPAEGLGSWPERIARKAAGRPAMTYGDQTITYATLQARVTRLANAMRGIGVEAGSRVAYLGSNHPAFVECLFATSAIGAVFVPLNTRLTPAEIDFMLDDCGATVLVFGGGSVGTVADLHNAAHPQLVAVEQPVAGALDYGAMIAEAQDREVEAEVDLDSACMIMYTSGTTGRPKGAILTHNNVIWNCLNVLVDLDVRSDEVTLVTAPMFHTAALNMTCLPTMLKGGRLLIEERFDAAMVIETVERMHVTLLFGVPTMFAALLESPRWVTADLSSLRVLLCGGAPVPTSLITTYHDRGLSFVQGYGMTEASPGALMVDANLSRESVGAAGVAHFFSDVRLLRDDGTPAAPGEHGEVVVAGPNVMRGYWGLPDATEQAFVGGRWFRSGDVAVSDVNDVITIVDRLKDVYISGGENVYPAEVEKALCDHESVAEAAVVGMADATWGEVGKAFIVLARGRVASEEELTAYLRTRIAGYKIPRWMIFLDSLPHTGSGKVIKSRLRVESD